MDAMGNILKNLVSWQGGGKMDMDPHLNLREILRFYWVFPKSLQVVNRPHGVSK